MRHLIFSFGIFLVTSSAFASDTAKDLPTFPVPCEKVCHSGTVGLRDDSTETFTTCNIEAWAVNSDGHFIQSNIASVQARCSKGAGDEMTCYVDANLIAHPEYLEYPESPEYPEKTEVLKNKNLNDDSIARIAATKRLNKLVSIGTCSAPR